jgi:hypothetical protein
MKAAGIVKLLTTLGLLTTTACAHRWELDSRHDNSTFESSVHTVVGELAAAYPYRAFEGPWFDFVIYMESAGDLAGFSVYEKLEAGSLRVQGYECRKYRNVSWRPIWATALSTATTDYAPAGCEQVRSRDQGRRERPIQDASLDQLVSAAEALGLDCEVPVGEAVTCRADTESRTTHSYVGKVWDPTTGQSVIQSEGPAYIVERYRHHIEAVLSSGAVADISAQTEQIERFEVPRDAP